MHDFHALADKIRDKVDPDFAAKVDPDHQHLHAAALGVAEVLGMDPNAFNVGHLSMLLSEHVTPPSREFPKMKYHHVEKREHVVASADEEKELGEGWHNHHWSAPAPQLPASAVHEPLKAPTLQSFATANRAPPPNLPPRRDYPKIKYQHEKKLECVVHGPAEEAELGLGWSDQHWSASAV
jgi:hypothetical protein